MKPCPHVENGCNAPEGQCSEACMKPKTYSHQHADPEMPIQYAGSEPWPTPIRWLAIFCLVVIVLAFLIPLSFFAQ